MDWLNNVVNAASAQSSLEWVAVIASLAYVILASYENIWCWFFGIIGVIASLIVYWQSKFYLDAGLQVYYLFMSFFGWYMWGKNKAELPMAISRRKLNWHLIVILLGIAAAYPLGKISNYFGGTLPFVDAVTTSFSLITTWMVAKKILENWLYWIVIDLICVWAYWTKGLELFSLLFLLYAIIAIFGFMAWNKKSPTQKLFQAEA